MNGITIHQQGEHGKRSRFIVGGCAWTPRGMKSLKYDPFNSQDAELQTPVFPKECLHKNAL